MSSSPGVSSPFAKDVHLPSIDLIRIPDPKAALTFFKRFKNLRDFDPFIFKPTRANGEPKNYRKLHHENLELALSLYHHDQKQRVLTIGKLFAEFSFALQDVASLSHEYTELELLQGIKTQSTKVRKRIIDLFADKTCNDFDSLVIGTAKLIEIAYLIDRGRKIPRWESVEIKKHTKLVSSKKNELKKYLKSELPQLVTLAKEENLVNVREEFRQNVLPMLRNLPSEKADFSTESQMVAARCLMIVGEIVKLLPDKFIAIESVKLVRLIRDTNSHNVAGLLCTFYNTDNVDFCMDMSKLIVQIYEFIFEGSSEPSAESVDKYRKKKSLPNARPDAHSNLRNDLENIISDILKFTKCDAGFVLWDCAILALEPRFMELLELTLIAEHLLQSGQWFGSMATVTRVKDELHLTSANAKQVIPVPHQTFQMDKFLVEGQTLQQCRSKMLRQDEGCDKMKFLVDHCQLIFLNAHSELERVHHELNECHIDLSDLLQKSLSILNCGIDTETLERHVQMALERANLRAKIAFNIFNPLDYPSGSLRSASIEQMTQDLAKMCPNLSSDAAREHSDPSPLVRFLALVLVSILQQMQRSKTDPIPFEAGVLRKLRNFWAHPGFGRSFPGGLKSDGSAVTEARALACLIYMTQLHLDAPYFDQILRNEVPDDQNVQCLDTYRRRSASESALNFVTL